MYCSLREVIRICCSLSIPTEQEINALREHSREFLGYCLEIKSQFNETIVPKAHYVSHSASQLARFGPFVYYSSLRFERKHKFFKEWSKRMKNYQNPLYSLTSRHQHHIALVYYKRLNQRLLESPVITHDNDDEEEYQPIYFDDMLSQLFDAKSSLKTGKNILRYF